jgi:hypothetical protein
MTFSLGMFQIISGRERALYLRLRIGNQAIDILTHFCKTKQTNMQFGRCATSYTIVQGQSRPSCASYDF